jgi:hypothetical protein
MDASVQSVNLKIGNPEGSHAGIPIDAIAWQRNPSIEPAPLARMTVASCLPAGGVMGSSVHASAQ